MSKQQARIQSQTDLCVVCGGKVGEHRHVLVESFYDARTVPSPAQRVPILQEIPEESDICGVTRRYPAGTVDRFVPIPETSCVDGVAVVRLEVTQEPSPPTRLLERPAYRVDCCKRCRDDFIALFKRWTQGDFVRVEVQKPSVLIAQVFPEIRDD